MIKIIITIGWAFLGIFVMAQYKKVPRSLYFLCWLMLMAVMIERILSLR